MKMADPFACVNREALGAYADRYGSFCFFVDGLGNPGPAPVKDGEAYRCDVKESIAWHPGYREVVQVLYHSPRSVTFLSPLVGHGAWASLDPGQMREWSVAAGYTVGNFVHQYHPCDSLYHNPLTWGSRDPIIVSLKAEPGFIERLPVVAHLMVAMSTQRVYPDRTCVVGVTADDAYMVASVRRLMRADIDYASAEAFFSCCLHAGLTGTQCVRASGG
jgi:hypothetical protein